MNIIIDTKYLINKNITAQDYVIAYLIVKDKEELSEYLKNTEELQTNTIERLRRSKFIVDNNDIFSKIDINSLEPTEWFKKNITPVKTQFEEFWDAYPTCVKRKDGMMGMLKYNKDRVKQTYNKIVGEKVGMHEIIMNALKEEISIRERTDTMAWMKSAYNWLIQRSWEIEENKKEEVFAVDTRLE